MEEQEDRSELFNEIQKFSQRKLKKVETKVKTGLGDDVVEKRTAKGLLSSDQNKNAQNDQTPVNQNVNKKLDLQVGFVTAGLMIGSNDVATCSKTLNEYGITHVLNLAPNETQSFQYEDDYNYLPVRMDENQTKLKDVLEKCFDFIEEGQQRGNCFVHCSTAKPGLSRSTTICIAYLINKNKKNYADAFNDVKEARAFVRPSDWFAKQLQDYATEQGAKAQEVQVEDAFTAKKRKEIEEEKAMLSKAVNLQRKKNLFDKQAEESQKRELEEKMQQEKLKVNKLKNNPAFNYNGNQTTKNANYDQSTGAGPRKLTSLMSIFQQKDNEPIKPINKVVLNSAPVKKWAPVSTPHLQRTVKPETKNYDFYSKVKKAKSKDFKRAESLRKSKSKLSNNVDSNNNQITSPPIAPPLPAPIKSVPPPPPPPPAQPIKSNTLNKTTFNKAPVAAPPPPPLPISQPVKTVNNIATNRIGLQNNKSQPQSIKTPSPNQSINSSRTSSPQPPSNNSSRVSSPIPSNNTFINKPSSALQKTSIALPSPSPLQLNTNKLNNGLTKQPVMSPKPQNKLDLNRFNKFSNPNDNALLNEKCVDYSNKLINSKPPVEVVRNIPIKMESSPTSAVNSTTKNDKKKKEEVEEEIIELEVEESSEESEESEEESEESEEESEEEESEESEEESEESSEESSSSESEEEVNVVLSRPKMGGLSRSATQEILRMIKSKNNEDINPLKAITEEDEEREIDLLLNGLEQEGVENIDWSEFEMSLDEIQNIIAKN